MGMVFPDSALPVASVGGFSIRSAANRIHYSQSEVSFSKHHRNSGVEFQVFLQALWKSAGRNFWSVFLLVQGLPIPVTLKLQVPLGWGWL